MNLTLDRPQPRKQSVAETVVERLKSRFVNDADRGTSPGPTAWAYSFTSDCECPDDCLRDHKNE